eukprot:TRINITY_DN26024_c0_g1_i10.p2 TRINITY_DN26024_c0_g1~~TRINITY_DN26024_c0_g1_i10.p2  ORF type:complete len:302 (+),score=30.87 TRINITY_DN26024_c0_g1_i10:243-1148(+)
MEASAKETIPLEGVCPGALSEQACLLQGGEGRKQPVCTALQRSQWFQRDAPSAALLRPHEAKGRQHDLLSRFRRWQIQYQRIRFSAARARLAPSCLRARSPGALLIRLPQNNYTREICCMDGGGRLPRTSLNGGQDHDKALQEDAVRAFEMLVHAGAGMPRPWMQEEVHFKTQLKVIVEDCGFDPMLIKDFWHLNSDRENVNRQVKQMLVTIFGKSVRQSSRYVDKFFPPEGHADVRALRHSTAASERLRTFYRYRETVQKVLDYVKNDYATFGMHLPDWIQGIPSRTDVEKGRRAMMRMR